MRNLTLERKIIFKTIAISKIFFQLFITTILKYVVNELEKWLKRLFYGIKHETLCNDYKVGGLKNVDIPNKIMALQWSWIRRLYDDSFNEWKLIPLYLFKNHLALLLNFIQIYSLKVIKRSFSHLSIGKLFWTGKNILLWWLKYLLARCLNMSQYQSISGTIKVSRWIKPPLIF